MIALWYPNFTRKSVRVVKFKAGSQQLLPAYQLDIINKRNAIEVLDVGPHENFYREVQKYLDAYLDAR